MSTLDGLFIPSNFASISCKISVISMPEAMASTSASSVQRSFKYDVFLSFRGEDTRKNFVDHLYHALVSKGIITYKDDEKIEKGEMISDQLIRSIEDSRFYIIVFSKNYASSSWCLDELVKIMECQKMMEKTAYPVFYDVEPTEVRNQSGSVGEAFAKHVEKEAAGRWRDALKEAAGLAGWELKNTVDGHEAKFIQKIVQDILLEPHFINCSIDGKLVGMETRVKNVVSSLETGSDDVCMIGIKGMGGGGKTTLARAVFDHISIWFEGKSFVENVREASKGCGLNKLQKQVLSDVLNDQSIVVTNTSNGKNMMKRMMCSRKVLVVLDDVDDIGQLEALAGEPSWFKPGSKIIVTTRDEQVLVAHRVNFIHDVNLLSRDEAVCLFSRHAFGREIPIQGYEELSQKVVNYAAGLPLTIKVLGSFLCGRNEGEWVDAIERIKRIPLKQTLEKLELSYNGLEHDHKEIFLDVACILRNEKKDKAIRILESCGFYAEIGLRVLEQKSLITISDTNRLRLHDHIVEMGINIVRRLHPDEPKRHNRLWIKNEIEDILVNNLGTKAIRSMKLEYMYLHADVIMKGLRKMKELRCFYMVDRCYRREFDEVDQYLPDTLQSLHWPSYPYMCLPKTFRANKLVNLEMEWSDISQLWEGGERKVLNKLRFLDLSHSKLRTFDLGMTPNLEKLVLESCKDFVELNMPDESPKLKLLSLPNSKLCNLNLGLTPHLETLYLRYCHDFVELHMAFKCPNLKLLDLGGSKVRKFNLVMAPHLETLDLRGCTNFLELHMPIECPKLKSINLLGSKVSNLNLGLTPLLETLDLRGCSDFVELHMPVECPKLKLLDLSCTKVSNLNLVMAPHLETLVLAACYEFVDLRMPVECPKLKSLILSYCHKFTNLYLGLTPHLETLELKGCSDLVGLHIPAECPNLKSLNLSGSKVSNLNLGLTPNLVTLDLKGCNDFAELHIPIVCQKLKSLNLSGSKVSNLNLWLTPHLETLDLIGCNDFVELHMPVECRKLKSLNLSESKVSNLNLGLTPHLEKLDLRGCNDFLDLHMPVECRNLRFLNLSGSKVSNLNLGMAPCIDILDLEGCSEFVELHMPVKCPMLRILYLSGSKVSNLNLGMTPRLRGLVLKDCNYLQEIQAPVGFLNMLVVFNLSGCLRFEHFLVDKRYELPVVATLELSAESLDICPLHPNSNLPKFRFKCLHLPLSGGNLEKLLSFGLCACTNLELFSASICGLQHLRVLTLEGNIPEIPKDLYQLKSLEELTLSMKEIKHLPDSICMLKHLKYLELKSCWLLEQLPKDLGRLECLEELHLTDCRSLQDIPNSICKMMCLKYLYLPYCSLVDKLPEEFGCLECLKVLDIEGAGISNLPQSIFQLKGLCIVGSRQMLESYGFTSLRNISRYTASCYVRDSQHVSPL